MKSTSARLNRATVPFRLVGDSWIRNPRLLKGNGTSEKSAHAVRFLTVPSAPDRLVTRGLPRGYGGIHTSSQGMKTGPATHRYHSLRTGARARMTLSGAMTRLDQCHAVKARQRLSFLTTQPPSVAQLALHRGCPARRHRTTRSCTHTPGDH